MTNDNLVSTERSDAASHQAGLAHQFFTLAANATGRYATERKDRAADLVIDLAATIRRSARRFEGQQDWLADAIDKGAGTVRDLAEDVRQAEIRDLAVKSREFARQRPRLFAAGAIAVGVVAAIWARHAFVDLSGQQAARAS